MLVRRLARDATGGRVTWDGMECMLRVVVWGPLRLSCVAALVVVGVLRLFNSVHGLIGIDH